LSSEQLDEYLDSLAEKKLISRKALSNGTLYIPKMQEYADEYTRKLLTNSRHTPDKLPLEENRIEENRKEKKRLFFNNLPIRKKDGKLWVIQKDGGPWKEYVGNIKDLEER